MSRFLLATWDGGGVITAELALVEALLDRGHEVLVVADDTVEAEALATGADFVPWTRAPHARARDRDRALVRDWEIRNPIREAELVGGQLFFGPARDFAHDVTEEIERWKPDVVVADAFLGGVMAAAEAAGLPLAAVAPNVNMLRADGVPALGGGFRPPKGPLGRLRDAAMHKLNDRLLDIGPLNAARAELGLPPVASMDAMVRRADRVILLTSAAFDFTPTIPDPQVVYGGVPEPRQPTLTWSPPWLDDGRQAVLVALGSTYQRQEELLQRVIDALALIDCHALVTLGPGLAGLSPDRVPDNVHVVDSAPHGAVFPHVGLCISHGGHGTVVRSLAAGVPLLVVPMGRDQPDNSVRVVAAGAGIRLPKRAKVETLREAISVALLDRELHEAARALAARMAPELGAPAAVHALELLAR
jgi:MGT family glycosyltransferase